MPRDGSATKVEIMDTAENLILKQGFAGTTVEDVIRGAGVTKGAFFHHFGSKQDLAQALIDRFAYRDQNHLEGKMMRAEALQRDPLQQLLLFVGFFIEEADVLIQPSAGCLIGSYIYEAGLFDDEIIKVMEENLIVWRHALRTKLDEVVSMHPLLIDVDLDSLADQITVVFEGAFIVSKTLREPDVLAQQLRHLRNYLELLFGAVAPNRPLSG